jgi:transcriptional regulator of nitric oxide reductase
MAGHEDSARSLRTDRAINHFASVRRLKLDTSIAALVAIWMVLIVDGDFRNLWLRRGQVSPCAKDSDNPYGAAQQ